MDEAATVALGLISANGPHGMSEKALMRSQTTESVTKPAMQSGLDQLAAAGLIERTIRTRTAGWVYVVTAAGAEHLRP
jgi:hypothetical protein